MFILYYLNNQKKKIVISSLEHLSIIGLVPGKYISQISSLKYKKSYIVLQNELNK